MAEWEEYLVAATEQEGDDGSAWCYLGELYEFGHEYRFADWHKAFECYQKGAAKGAARCQAGLGVFYATGRLQHEPNLPKALTYLTFAALAGDLTAAHILGHKYAGAEDVPESCELSFVNYLKVSEAQVSQFLADGHFATPEFTRLSLLGNQGENRAEDISQYLADSAELGDPQELERMGKLYYKGSYGLPQSYQQAFYYLKQAADSSRIEAMAMLGCLYYRGQGTPQQQPDYAAAEQYLKRAIELGDSATAHNCLGEMYARGLAAGGINEERAMQHFMKAASDQYAEAQFNAGQFFLYGRGGTPQNLARAVEFFTVASSQGHPMALHQMALIHFHGLEGRGNCASGLKIMRRSAQLGQLHGQLLARAYSEYNDGNYDGATALYERAALMGYHVAQFNAAFLYDKSYTTLVSDAQLRLRRARHYYEAAAKQQSAHAFLRLGDFYFYGLAGLGQDYEKANAYYKYAADLHHSQGCFNIGHMYQFGLGTPQDFYLAKRYYDMSLSSNPHSWLAWAVALSSLAAHYVYQEGLPTQEILSSLNVLAQSEALQIDTILLVFLALILVFCFSIRYALYLK